MDGGTSCKPSKIYIHYIYIYIQLVNRYEEYNSDCQRESVDGCDVCASRFVVDLNRKDCNFGTKGYIEQEYNPFDSTFPIKRRLCKLIYSNINIVTCGNICGGSEESCVKYNPTTTKCKTCGENKFLQITEQTDRAGDCIDIGNSPNSYKLYVRPVPLLTESNIQSAGTSHLPFNDIEQALTKVIIYIYI